MSLPRIFVTLLFVAGVMACNHNDSSASGSGNNDPAPRDLVNRDIAAFKNNSALSTSITSYDQSNKGVFTKVFGGTSDSAILDYFNTRIHYFYTASELKKMTISPSRFRNSSWSSDDSPSDDSDSKSDVVVGASNIGMALWLMGLLDGVTVVINAEGKDLTVDSSRFGLMEIGPGYMLTEHTKSGRAFTIPAAYRQAILLHEARHSDCTGGISNADLAILRNTTSMKSMQANYKNKKCGHMHSICSGGDYAGLPGCDDIPWGAYAVQLVYLKAAYGSTSGLDNLIMRAGIIDTASRLQFDADDMFAGKFGDPDMSSSGLRQP